MIDLANRIISGSKLLGKIFSCLLEIHIREMYHNIIIITFDVYIYI
jgi:hypothetical protein